MNSAEGTEPGESAAMTERGGMTEDIELRCKDDPEANGRKPLIGEQRFTLLFPLENGNSLRLHMGREGMNHFETFIAQMMIDDHSESEAPDET